MGPSERIIYVVSIVMVGVLLVSFVLEMLTPLMRGCGFI
jgi:hypothetical protein